MKKILIVAAVLASLGGALFFHSALSCHFTNPFTPVALPTSSSTPSEPASENASQSTANYSDPDYHFSLSYPNDLELHIYPEDNGGRTVAFEGPSPGEGFQVYVQPYSGTSITDQQFE